MEELKRLEFERNTLKAEVARLTIETERQRGQLEQIRKATEPVANLCKRWEYKVDEYVCLWPEDFKVLQNVARAGRLEVE